MSINLPFDIVELVPCPMMSVRQAPLREIAFRHDAWLPEEIDTLHVLFRGDADFAEIESKTGRSVSAIRTKVSELGLRRNSRRSWTDLEDEELARRYGTDPTSTVASDFGRSAAAIYARAGYLGLTEGNPPSYTEWEIAQIRAGYGGGVPVSQIAVLIARPVSGIASVASRLGISHANAPPDWTGPEQLRALVLAEEGRRYRQIAADLAADGFPPRPHNAVGQALRKLGYGRGWGRPWTAEEDDLLRATYASGDSRTPLRTRLARSASSINWRAKELDLQGTHPRPNGWRTEPPWTEEDIAILRRDYGKIPTPQLATKLGRKKGGVFNKAHSLGLLHGYIRPFSADEDTAILIAHGTDISLTDLSEALRRDPAVVSKHAIRMGIPFSKRPVRAPRTRRALRSSFTLEEILLLGRAASPRPQAAVTASRPAALEQTDPHAQVQLVAGPGVPPASPLILRSMLAAGLLSAQRRSGMLLLFPATRSA